MAAPFASFKNMFLIAFPHFSIIVALLIIIGQLTIVGLILISPASLGLFETIYSHGTGTFNETVLLNTQQSISLGIATIVIIVEGVVFGIVLSYQQFRKSVFAAHHLQPVAVPETDISPSTRSPLVQESDSVDYNTLQSEHVSIPSSFSARAYFKLHPNKKTLVIKQITLYIAEIAFEVVQFLMKWTLVLLVIRGNWVSVGVTIAGGIYHPIVQFWKSFLAAERMKMINPPVRPT